MAGLHTAGELVDRVKALDKGNRRRLLDAARQLAGPESIETIEARRRVEAASAAAHVKMARNPGPLRLAVRPGGAIVDLDDEEAEAARAQVELESRRRVLEQEQAARAVEAEALTKHRPPPPAAHCRRGCRGDRPGTHRRP